jgi:transcription initiation factor TFIIB
MSFDELYKTLDEVNEPVDKIKENNCCDNIENYMYTESEIKCKCCDSLIDDILNVPEWRYYGSQDSKRSDPTRCGMPVNLLLPGSSLGTTINNKGNIYDRISTRQNWNSMPYKERSKYKVFMEISSKCGSNNLPNIIGETAKSLYSVISDTKISRGKNRKGIIAACVFNSCKECKVPRSVKEIAKMFDMDPKVLTKGCKNYTEISRLNKINVKREQGSDTINLIDFVERFCYNLSISEKDMEIIKDISNICKSLNLIYDNTPPAMASGCIYLVLQLKKVDISKKIISENCNISEVTVNKCYKKLLDNEKLMSIIHSKYVFTV